MRDHGAPAGGPRTPDQTPAIVLLAAGASRRLGEPKALARLRDKRPRTPLEFLLVATSGLDPRPLVVTGADDLPIRSFVESEGPCATAGLEILENRAWERGRTGSVLVARDARPGRDLLLAPVDVPLVPGEVFSELVALWKRVGAPARGWLAPRFRGQRGRMGSARGRHGHPVIVGRDLVALLTPGGADRPLRELRARADPLLDWPVDTPAVLDDLDTREDLRLLRDRLARDQTD